MPKFELTRFGDRDAVWSENPPDPLDDPDLYDEIMLRRVLAYGIDAAILMMLVGAMWVLVIFSLGLLWPAKLILTPLLPILYHSYFVGACGATLGMQLMDVEVRSWTGRRPDYFQAFVLTALFYATVFPSGFLILIVCLLNDRRRTLHDFLAGTVSVRYSHRAATKAGLA